MDRRFARRAACAVAALLLAALVVPLGPASVAAHATATTSARVTMRVADVMPDTPAPSYRPHRLDVVLSLHNGTAHTLRNVSISAGRGYPVGTLQGFNHLVSHPAPPPPSTLCCVNSSPAEVTLLAGASVQVVFHTKTEIPTDSGICLCADAIYPLYFIASHVDGGVTRTVATARTFIPSFKEKVAKLHVGWVWPLLDRPHRLGVDPTVFTDDTLAQEVAPGGRLDTMLRVVERVVAQVPMTLVVDPDLIDELHAMAQGPYRLQPPGKKLTKVHTGTAAAQSWLQRLRSVLGTPGVEIDLTPPGDPDVDSLARDGLQWTVAVSQEEQSHVTDALGGQTPLSDITWPVGGRLSQATLDELASQGTNTVILSDAALQPTERRSESALTGDALASLETATGSTEAALTSPPVQQLVSTILSSGPQGFAALPRLVSLLALRVIASPHQSHYLTITPPRDLGSDPRHPLDPDVAVRLILATARTSWASADPLRVAASAITPSDDGRLRSERERGGLSPDVLDAAGYVSDSLPGLYTLFSDHPADARQVHLDTLPTTVQRLESSSLIGAPKVSAAAADRVRGVITKLRQNSVYLVPPANGKGYTYTLTSDKSSLTVTVVNNLTVPVRIRLSMSRTSGPPGFTAGDIGEQTINPGVKKQLKVPTQVSVLGRYQVGVQLSTPSGLALGSPLELSVRSTALGTIGVVITVVAGVVLAIALLVRLVVRLRRRRRRAALRLADPPAATAATAGR